MFWRILRKDIRKRKSINIILFLFLALASVFLSSSANNIMVVASAVDYYMDYANISDVAVITAGTEEADEIAAWIQREAPGVRSYGKDRLVLIRDMNISVKQKGNEKAFDSHKLIMCLGTMGAEYARVFDEKGQEFSLEPGEIAVSRNVMENNGLKLGDVIILKEGQLSKEFRIRQTVKDAAFGNEMSGINRLFVSPQDFALFEQEQGASLYSLHYVNFSGKDPADNITAFTTALSSKGFTTLANTITKSTHKLVYSFDMIVAALLIFIGICLILIAMLVLRFTLVFTMEEEYREIGIMKAIGLKRFAVRKLYLVKYLVLVTAGALLGFAVSVPVSRAMVESVAANMIMEDSGAKLWLNILCTLAVIVVVLLFCYRCTHRMDKISAIAAVRGGQTGERFGRKAGLRLHKQARLPLVFFLGINDMLSHVRRYLILILTFCLSIILITIPLNTLNTMRSREMSEKFGINPDSAVYVGEIELPEENYTDTGLLKKGMERVEEEMREAGYEARLSGTAIFFITYCPPTGGEGDSPNCPPTGGEGDSPKVNIMTLQAVGANPHFLTYDEGVEPLLENEIAFSHQIMELYDWKIGDAVTGFIGGEEKTFIITGSYTDYMQMGQSARLNSRIDCEKERMFQCWSIMVDMDIDRSQAELANELQEKFPDYEWTDAQEIIDRNVGSIQQTLDDMLLPMTGMLCILIMLITLLMEKLFIVKERGEIAMMKSIGFKDCTIRLWQVMRMVYVVFFSMAAAVPISLISNRWILKPLFGIMGAEVKIQVNPWQAYGLYPGILLIGIVAATILAARGIRKIRIQEINHAE